MKRFLSLVIFFFLIHATSHSSEFFEIKKVADGVYAAIGKPGILMRMIFPIFALHLLGQTATSQKHTRSFARVVRFHEEVQTQITG